MKIRIKLLVFFIAACLLFASIGIYTISVYHGFQDSERNLIIETNDSFRLYREAEANFRSQLNAWKNVLLRGDDIKRYHLYLQEFYQSERETRKTIQELYETNPEEQEFRDNIRKLQAAHLQIGRELRNALRLFNATTLDPVTTADRYITENENTTIGLFNQIVEQLRTLRDERLAELTREQQEQEKILLILILVTLLGSVLILLWLLDKNIGQPAEQATYLSRVMKHAEFAAAFGTWNWSSYTDKHYWSSGLYNLLGLDDRKNPSIDCFLECLVENDRDRIQHTLVNALRNNSSFEEEAILKKCTDGKHEYIHMRGQVSKTQYSEDIRMICVVYNITKRREAEERLRKTTEHLFKKQNILLELANQEISEPELSFKRVIEADAEELELNRISLWLYDDDRSSITCQFTYENGQFSGNVDITLTKQDYPLYFQAISQSTILTANNVQNDPRFGEFRENYLIPHGITSIMDVPVRLQGEVVGIICHEHVGPQRVWTVEDEDFVSSIAEMCALTIAEHERKKADYALRKSEEKLSKAFENSPDGIAITRASDGKIVYANPSWAKYAKYDLDEVIGKSSLELGLWVNPEDRKKLIDLLGEGSEVRNYEAILRAKDGECIPMSISASLIEIDNEKHMVSLTHDITGQKRAEQALTNIAEYSTSAGDTTYFEFVANYLTQVLEVEYAFVGRLMPFNKIESLATSRYGRIEENFTYDLAGTPCENVIGQHFCIYQDDLQKSFPADQLLRGMDVNSYAGVPINNTEGKPIGIVVVMDNKPFKYPDLTELLLQVFGIRCTAEFERIQANMELNEYQKQLRALASDIIIAEEQERRRIAIELHDYIIQDLGLSKIKLGELMQKVSGDDSHSLAKETRNLIDGIIKESRTLVFDLSLPVLYELGFVAAINWLAEQTSEKLNIPCNVHDDGKNKPMDKETQVLLFKAIRELLINVGKHAQAKEVNITIQRSVGHIDIMVEDDGTGFNPAEITTSSKELKFGLFGIRERLNLLNGLVTINSSPGKGCRITLTAPLDLDN